MRAPAKAAPSTKNNHKHPAPQEPAIKTVILTKHVILLSFSLSLNYDKPFYYLFWKPDILYFKSDILYRISDIL